MSREFALWIHLWAEPRVERGDHGDVDVPPVHGGHVRSHGAENRTSVTMCRIHSRTFRGWCFVSSFIQLSTSSGPLVLVEWGLIRLLLSPWSIWLPQKIISNPGVWPADGVAGLEVDAVAAAVRVQEARGVPFVGQEGGPLENKLLRILYLILGYNLQP